MRGSLREKTPGRWELRVPLPPDPVTGRRRRRSASFEGTKRQAERELARLVAEADDDRGAAQSHTLEHLLERWWEQKEARLSPTTAREYERIIAKRLVPTMGTRKVASIAPADLDTYYMRLAKEGLAAEPELGALLPCNVVIYERGGSTRVAAVEPETLLGIVGNAELQPIAARVREDLASVVEGVAQSRA